jgi:Tol biopolymer transport system component
MHRRTWPGDACPQEAPDRSRGYVWGVFAGYDIYLATDDGQIEKRLTDTPGYDAEGTVNWKTGNIVYTSHGLARSGPLDHENGRLAQETDHQGRTATTAARFSRATASKLVWRANYPQTPEEWPL